MSPSLFTFFADQSTGKFPITWEFVDDSAPAPPSPSPPTTTQVTTPQVEPTTPIVYTTPTIDYNAPATTPVEEVTTPIADAYVAPTPEPETTWTEVTGGPATSTEITGGPATSTDSASAATATPTPPTFGEQLALAIKDGDVNGLGKALAELGALLQNNTTTTAITTASY